MSLIRKGDLVEVTLRHYRGSRKDEQGRKVKDNRGKVLQVLPREDKVVVEGLNLVVKHTPVRMTQKGQEGGIVEVEAPIHISNVRYVDPKTDKPVRLGVHVDEQGKKHRITRGRNSSATIID